MTTAGSLAGAGVPMPSHGRRRAPRRVPETRRYYADSPVVYALAAIALFDYARAHPGEKFAFGPLTAAEMTAGGLVIAGEGLAGPAAVLAAVPGLAEDTAEGGTRPD